MRWCILRLWDPIACILETTDDTGVSKYKKSQNRQNWINPWFWHFVLEIAMIIIHFLLKYYTYEGINRVDFLLECLSCKLQYWEMKVKWLWCWFSTSCMSKNLTSIRLNSYWREFLLEDFCENAKNTMYLNRQVLHYPACNGTFQYRTNILY